MNAGVEMPAYTARVDTLDVRVYRERAALGAAAGTDVAALLRALLAHRAAVRMVFAAAPSQTETLATLRAAEGIDWSRVAALHMDEYLDLPVDAPQRFGRFLATHLFAAVRPGHVEYLAPQAMRSANGAAIAAECARYTAIILAAPIDIVCLGVGENGHIAFNDPPVADFADPATVKPVTLDAVCRQQQVNDGCFPNLAAVPYRALTLTVPALLSGATPILCGARPDQACGGTANAGRTRYHELPRLRPPAAPRLHAVRRYPRVWRDPCMTRVAPAPRTLVGRLVETGQCVRLTLADGRIAAMEPHADTGDGQYSLLLLPAFVRTILGTNA